MNTPITTPPTYSDRTIRVYVPAHPTVLDTSNLSFPVSDTSGTTLTSTEVMMFFHRIYLPAGYYEVSTTPSLKQNCYGYAAGWNLWLTRAGLDAVLGADYTYYTKGRDLGGAAVLVVPGHAVVADSTKTMVSGEWEYRIVETKEKNGTSGIYGKKINLPDGLLFDKDDDISLGIMGGTAAGFWKEN